MENLSKTPEGQDKFPGTSSHRAGGRCCSTTQCPGLETQGCSGELTRTSPMQHNTRKPRWQCGRLWCRLASTSPAASSCPIVATGNFALTTNGLHCPKSQNLLLDRDNSIWIHSLRPELHLVRKSPGIQASLGRHVANTQTSVSLIQ